MILKLQKIIFENASEWLRKPSIKNINFVKIAGHSTVGNRTILIGFINDESQPSVTVKISRNNFGNQEIKNEHNHLITIHEKFPELSGIPIPLYISCDDNLVFSIESAMVGKLMGNMRSEWLSSKITSRMEKRIRSDFELAVSWLVDFNRATIQHISGSAQSLNSIYQLSFPSTFPDNIKNSVNVAIETTDAYFDKYFSSDQLPLILEHGDFWAGNIIKRGQTIGVIDWVDASENILPFYDLSYFIISYTLGFLPKDNSRLWVYKDLVTGQGWFYNLAHEVINRYSNQLSIKPVDPWFLFGYAAIRRALMMAERKHQINPWIDMINLWLNSR